MKRFNVYKLEKSNWTVIAYANMSGLKATFKSRYLKKEYYFP